MGQPETKVGDLCAELGISRQTPYRFVGPKGELRDDGKRLRERRAGRCAAACARPSLNMAHLYLIRILSYIIGAAQNASL